MVDECDVSAVEDGPSVSRDELSGRGAKTPHTIAGNTDCSDPVFTDEL